MNTPETRPTDEDNVGSTWNWLPAKTEQAQTANVVEQTKVILRKYAPWIEKYLALVATPMQEPRDLIADALRRAGYDLYASGSKATEIMQKENPNMNTQPNMETASDAPEAPNVGHWTCPYCGHDNIDSKNLTAVPMCGGCGVDVHWTVIDRSGDWTPIT